MPDEEKKEVQKIKCPCCGELTLNQPVQVKSIILDEYMASIITGVPFTHTWELYNGTVKITVESLDKATNAALSAAVKAVDDWSRKLEEGTLTQLDAAKYTMLAKPLRDTLRMYCSIKEIIILRDGKLQKQFMPADVIREAMKKLFEASFVSDEAMAAAIEEYNKRCVDPAVLSTLSESIIRTVIVAQADLYTLLLDNGFDTNFWAGIELA